MQRPRVCVVSTTPLIVHFFLRPHVEGLAQFADVTLAYNPNNDSYTPALDLAAQFEPISIKRRIGLWSDFKALIELYSLFRRKRFDLIWTTAPKAGLVGMLAAWLAKVPVRVFIFQGEVWASKQGLGRWLLKSIDRLIVSRASHVLAVSASERDFLVAEGVVPAGRVEVLGSGSIGGVDLTRYRPEGDVGRAVRAELGITPDATVALFLGRLNSDKGVQDLAEAFRRVAERCGNLWLLVVGPDEGRMVPRILEILGPLSERCKIVGFAQQPEKYMAAADFLCLPSYREGFPVTILEAAAMGVPAIGSRIYGISDAICDGQTGLLVDVGDPGKLSEAMALLTENVVLRRRLGQAAQLRVARDFARDPVVERYLSYFRKCLDQ